MILAQFHYPLDGFDVPASLWCVLTLIGERIPLFLSPVYVLGFPIFFLSMCWSDETCLAHTRVIAYGSGHYSGRQRESHSGLFSSAGVLVLWEGRGFLTKRFRGLRLCGDCSRKRGLLEFDLVFICGRCEVVHSLGVVGMMTGKHRLPASARH